MLQLHLVISNIILQSNHKYPSNFLEKEVHGRTQHLFCHNQPIISYRRCVRCVRDLPIEFDFQNAAELNG